jgi:hypothetical protein
MSQPAFSAKEFQRLGEIMHDARSVDRSDRVWQLVSAVQKVIPYEFSGCGAVDLLHGIDPLLGHSTYPREFCQLYMGQGLVVDPAVNRLITSGQTVTSSADVPTADEPKDITSLKLDFGIKTCLSAGVRGVNGSCSYFAFSNFDAKQADKLRLLLDILTPHFHLSYMRCTSTWRSGATGATNHSTEQTGRRDSPLGRGRQNQLGNFRHPESQFEYGEVSPQEYISKNRCRKPVECHRLLADRRTTSSHSIRTAQ